MSSDNIILVLSIAIVVLFIIFRLRIKSLKSDIKFRDNTISKNKDEIALKNNEIKRRDLELYKIKNELDDKKSYNYRLRKENEDLRSSSKSAAEQHYLECSRLQRQINKLSSNSEKTRDIFIYKTFLGVFSDTSAFRAIYSKDVYASSRFEKALTDQSIEIVGTPALSAKIKGSTGNIYNVTLNSCTCEDFRRNGKPCKHMLKLAVDIGALSMLSADRTHAELKEVYSIKEEIEKERKKMPQNTHGSKTALYARKKKLLKLLKENVLPLLHTIINFSPKFRDTAIT